ncbi:MAG: hypothetical protein EXS16_18285 [Gemmataceae bacterium]|nr:hypothetical protein [Gemmataceae bacterium]
MSDEMPSPPADSTNTPLPAPIPVSVVSATPMQLPPIPLDPTSAKPRPRPKPHSAFDAKKPALESRDSFRELIETVVFVVVLVLMLKTFLAEAFVIPTGSMADTLLGYHHKAVCEKCRSTNLLNASSEAEPKEGFHAYVVVQYRCENCEHWNHRFRDPNER